MKNKAFKIILLIRNSILTLGSFVIAALGLYLVIESFVSKANGESFSAAIALVLGIIFLIIGAAALIYSVIYLIISIVHLKSKTNQRITTIVMIILEAMLIIASIVITIYQIKDPVMIGIGSFILLQSIAILVFLILGITLPKTNNEIVNTEE